MNVDVVTSTPRGGEAASPGAPADGFDLLLAASLAPVAVTVAPVPAPTTVPEPEAGPDAVPSVDGVAVPLPWIGRSPRGTTGEREPEAEPSVPTASPASAAPLDPPVVAEAPSTLPADGPDLPAPVPAGTDRAPTVDGAASTPAVPAGDVSAPDPRPVTDPGPQTRATAPAPPETRGPVAASDPAVDLPAPDPADPVPTAAPGPAVAAHEERLTRSVPAPTGSDAGTPAPTSTAPEVASPAAPTPTAQTGMVERVIEVLEAQDAAPTTDRLVIETGEERVVVTMVDGAVAVHVDDQAGSDRLLDELRPALSARGFDLREGDGEPHGRRRDDPAPDDPSAPTRRPEPRRAPLDADAIRL